MLADNFDDGIQSQSATTCEWSDSSGGASGSIIDRLGLSGNQQVENVAVIMSRRGDVLS